MKAIKLSMLLLLVWGTSCNNAADSNTATYTRDSVMNSAGPVSDSLPTGNGPQAASASYDTMTEGKATGAGDRQGQDQVK